MLLQFFSQSAPVKFFLEISQYLARIETKFWWQVFMG